MKTVAFKIYPPYTDYLEKIVNIVLKESGVDERFIINCTPAFPGEYGELSLIYNINCKDNINSEDLSNFLKKLRNNSAVEYVDEPRTNKSGGLW